MLHIERRQSSGDCGRLKNGRLLYRSTTWIDSTNCKAAHLFSDPANIPPSIIRKSPSLVPELAVHSPLTILLSSLPFPGRLSSLDMQHSSGRF